MYLPEYTITNNILRNIAYIEYAKALIETTTILPTWQKQLQIEARAKTITYSLRKDNINVDFEDVKRYLNNIPSNVPAIVKNYDATLNELADIAQTQNFEEEDIKQLYKTLTKNTQESQIIYRKNAILGNVRTEEILAQITSLIDWYNSLDAKQTHPLIVSAIMKARIEQIHPFEKWNSVMSDLIHMYTLKANKYNIKDYLSVEEQFFKSLKSYTKELKETFDSEDYTSWIEYLTDSTNREVSTLSENIKLLAKDTRLAKVSKRTELSERQEKIITYLQDFVYLKNKDFPKLFPNISEDTVLRELKNLTDLGIIAKRGKTKSSRYELT